MFDLPNTLKEISPAQTGSKGSDAWAEGSTAVYIHTLTQLTGLGACKVSSDAFEARSISQ